MYFREWPDPEVSVFGGSGWISFRFTGNRKNSGFHATFSKRSWKKKKESAEGQNSVDFYDGVDFNDFYDNDNYNYDDYNSDDCSNVNNINDNYSIDDYNVNSYDLWW